MARVCASPPRALAVSVDPRQDSMRWQYYMFRPAVLAMHAELTSAVSELHVEYPSALSSATPARVQRPRSPPSCVGAITCSQTRRVSE
jgi:hypothetical protein